MISKNAWTATVMRRLLCTSICKINSLKLSYNHVKHLSISVITLIWVLGKDRRNKGIEDDDMSLGLTLSIAVLTTDEAGTSNHWRNQERSIERLSWDSPSGHFPNFKYLWKSSFNSWEQFRSSSTCFLREPTNVDCIIPPFGADNFPVINASI